ncbi:subtilisin-like serine protease [Thermoplasmatales archaeon SCGC AB-540-F20]|nr:subtilisin-like serine protease [Thermoplasmatales archaeon SCGC AB-540-F20]
MKKKILGIFVCMLLIATVVPVLGNVNNIVSIEDEMLSYIEYNDIVPGEFIVKFTEEGIINGPSITALNNKHQVNSVEKIFKNAENTRLDNIYILYVPEDSDLLSIVSDYISSPYVVYAEPNYIGYLPLPIIPNDEYFTDQWPLNNSGQYGGIPDADIDAVEAWEIEKGDPNIVIASVDSGIDYYHEDIADNIWTNEDETPDNGIDDDGNGYIDDIVGWDFIDNDSTPLDNQTAPQYGHGTRCAGLHSAITNNGIGIAGVCWYCKTMVVRCYFKPSASSTFFAQGTVYAADNGADVINIEMAFNYNSQVLEDAVNYAYEKGCFLCAAAGNSNSSDKHYPAAYDNVTAVGATNQRDERCDEDDWGPGRGSNWGDWVDVAAPGNSIRTLNPNNNYPFISGGGTSLAAPFVAGLAGLILSKNPSLSPDEVTSLICDNVDPYISKYYIGTGRINAYKALVSTPPPIPDLYCIGSLSWTDVKPGSTVTDTFKVQNVGDPGSLLDWEITEWPDWGSNSSWTFTPISGEDLTPADGAVTVEVEVVAPDEENTDFEGVVNVTNTIDPDDFEIIDVSLATPKNKAFNYNFPLISWLLERFPNMFPILRHILGL